MKFWATHKFAAKLWPISPEQKLTKYVFVFKASEIIEIIVIIIREYSKHEFGAEKKAKVNALFGNAQLERT